MRSTDPPTRSCPFCGSSLTERESHSSICEECGREFSTERLLTREQDLVKHRAAERRAILAENLGVAMGTLMIAAGVTLICFSEVGPWQLASGWGLTISILTAAGLFRQRLYEEPVYPVLLGFGAVWLVMGMLLWGYL